MIQNFDEIKTHALAEDLVISLCSDDELKKDWQTTEEIDYNLYATYGVNDGKVFCRIREVGLEAMIEACKTLRDAEMVYKDRMNNPIGQDYVIPRGLRLELYARGIDVDKVVQSGDSVAWRPIDKVIEQEFPFFKVTNRSVYSVTKRKANKNGDNILPN